MATFAGDHQFKNIKSGHHRARFYRKGADWHAGDIVHPVNRFHGVSVEQTFLDHGTATTFVFFCGLENKVNRSFKFTMFCQIFGSSQ